MKINISTSQYNKIELTFITIKQLSDISDYLFKEELAYYKKYCNLIFFIITNYKSTTFYDEFDENGKTIRLNIPRKKYEEYLKNETIINTILEYESKIKYDTIIYRNTYISIKGLLDIFRYIEKEKEINNNELLNLKETINNLIEENEKLIEENKSLNDNLFYI